MQRIISSLEERYRSNLGHCGERPDPFKTLIGCVLSQRTRDKNTEKAAEALFAEAATPSEVLNLGEDRLRHLIRCSGFYNQKARYIMGICETLIKDFEGRTPDERECLLSLPGVGYKTADIVLSHAFDKPAIAVDVHVDNVAKRLGLVESEADPEEVKKALEMLVPREKLRFVDSAFVLLGKEYCGSRNPRCIECFLNPLCEYPRWEDKK